MTPLIRFSLAWFVGLLTHRVLPLPSYFLLIPAGAALYLYRESPTAKHVALAIIAFTLAGIRLSWAVPSFDNHHIAFYNGQTVTLTGLVEAAPDLRDTYQNIQLSTETITLDGAPQAVNGLVLVRAPRYPAWHYGDRLTLSGDLETPPIFEDFSYQEYLARYGIYSMFRRPHIIHEASGQGYLFWAGLYALKGEASATINRLLPEPHAALLNGILLGIESGIPPDLYEQFNRTGTSHIIVISGSNISLIAAIFLMLGIYTVGRRYAPWLAMIGVIGYTMLVGADSAVLRAAVMGSVWLFALAIGRPGMALNSLFAAALLLTLANPLIIGDVGFQLSFMATLGLILLFPILYTLTARLLESPRATPSLRLVAALLSSLLLITLAAQIITMPLMLYHFGRLSLVSLLTNMLIGPVQPFIMTLGGLATLGGMVWQPLGQLLSYFVWLPLAWTVAMVEWTAGWPYADLEMGRFPWWLMVLLYALIGSGAWWVRSSSSRHRPKPLTLPAWGSPWTRLTLGGSLSVALLMGLALLSLPDGYLHVAFLDVGQGDAILITLPDGQQILVDGGPQGSQLSWRLGQEMPFWDRSLDLLINTHPDQDHLGGFVPLLERYEVGQVLVSGATHRSSLYRAWQEELETHQLEPLIGRAGMELVWADGVRATLLHPGAIPVDESKLNNQSVVLELSMGNINFLLTGDIEAVVEHYLAAEGLLKPVTVLKSPHHGSSTSSSEALLQATNPAMVVIQVGAENRFGHPTAEVLARYETYGSTVLRTDEHGTIEFITDGQQLWVKVSR